MHPTLRFGSRGNDVVKLQTLLNQRPSGLPRLVQDGVFGPKTLARVTEFQRQNRLVADGVVGPKTWAALEAVPVLRKTAFCGNGDLGNLGRVASIRQQLVAALGLGGGVQQAAPRVRAGVIRGGGGGVGVWRVVALGVSETA